MSERPHHDMGTCWCGELHAREHVLARRVEQLETALRALANPDGIVRKGDPTFTRIPPHEFARAALDGGTATPEPSCPSTHGGSGYLAGSVDNGDGTFTCGGCGGVFPKGIDSTVLG